MVRPAERLLEMIKSARLEHATLALFTRVVLAYAAIALRSIWLAADPMLANAGASIGVAALLGFGLFAIAALALAWLMSGTLDGQQRALADLGRREEQLTEQAALLQNTLENM